MTYGEQWYAWKCKINSFSCKFDDTEQSPRLPKRMSKEDAVVYYSKKCRKAFLGLGFLYSEPDDFKKKIEFAFIKVRNATNKMLQREAKKNQVLLYSGLDFTDEKKD